MNRNDENCYTYQNDCRICVEMQENNITSVKYIEANEILKCLKDAAKFKFSINSGILPQNCIAYSEDKKKNKFVVISFEEQTADIMFEKQNIRIFLCRDWFLVFGFC